MECVKRMKRMNDVSRTNGIDDMSAMTDIHA